jgi:uncharacterized protein (DUF1697 family)
MTEVFVLLLRGVNVGGVRLPMADFRAFLVDLGLESVASYIQSGNAVFRAKSGAAEPLAATISAGLLARFGLDLAVFLYPLAEYQAILAACPWQAEGAQDGAKVHVVFHRAVLGGALSAHAVEGEGLTAAPGALYLHLPHGMGRSKLALQVPRHLKGDQTARNWRTCLALLEMGRDLEGGLTQG